MDELLEWYDSCDGTILYLSGAQGVGKSWLVDELCSKRQEKYIKVSAEHLSYDIIKNIGILVIHDINDKRGLDRAIRIILKIRSEAEFKNIRIIVESRFIAGNESMQSLLNDNYVKNIRVYPLNISEFASAVTRINAVDERDIIKLFLYVGGMPECVECFIRTGSLIMVREIQHKIIESIKENCSDKSRKILDAISLHIKNGDTSFTYRRLGSNAREREYGNDVRELQNMGIIYKTERFDDKGFRLYMNDVGLMACMLDIKEYLMIREQEVLEVYDEALVKNFVVQEYNCHTKCDMHLSYWHRTRAKARLPFVVKEGADSVSIINLCIGVNYSKSVKSFCEKHKVNKIYNIYVDDVSKGRGDKSLHSVYSENLSLSELDKIHEKCN